MTGSPGPARALQSVVHLARIAVAAALGRERGVVREARAAMKAGVPAASLREAVLQTYLFAGFPRAINAFIALAEAGAHPSEVHVERPGTVVSWRRRGERLCRRIYGRDFVPLMRRMRSLHPDFADWILVEGYGKTLSRPFLTPRERELIVVPVLAALGAWRQVPSHVKGAWNCGARSGEVEGVLAGALGARGRARAVRVVRDLWKETRSRERRV